MRRLVVHVAWCCAALALAAAGVRAQTPEAKSAGTISGRVTQEGKAAAGVVVMLIGQGFPARQALLERATTDEEGRYTLTNVEAGRYRVLAFAPAFIVADIAGTWPPGKVVSVSAGEAVEGVDFALTRGGVITGRVTDADGRPVVNQIVRVVPVELRPEMMVPMRYSRPTTDDRGVYRIYGLGPGRYRVSSGEEPEQGFVSGPRRLFRRTFHPNAAEESEARVVEVTAGGEAADVDITLSAVEKTYRLTGRVVDAETGRPAADVAVGVGPLMKGSQRLAGGYSTLRTDARGEFHAETLLPGRYSAFVQPSPNDERYGESLLFDVTDADVSGLELTVRRGASLSGVVVVEGTNDRAVLARLSNLTVSVSYDEREEGDAIATPRSEVGPDGSFRLTGLKPGRVRPRLFSWPRQLGLTLLRVERGGVEQSPVMEVAAGEQLAGVRLVVIYGAGVIRGRVLFEGDKPPPGVRAYVSARRAAAPEQSPAPPAFTEADARGHFVIENLPPGEYEVVARLMQRAPRGQPPRTLRQTVTVGTSGEANVTFSFEQQQQ